jgi:hypothetical protein
LTVSAPSSAISARDEAYDAAEISFSRYTQLRHDGDDSVVGIPNFIMRGFRHRCIITTKDSAIRTLATLRARRSVSPAGAIPATPGPAPLSAAKASVSRMRCGMPGA